MNKVSVFINYWIFIIAVMIFSKVSGVTFTKSATLKILILATALYIITVVIWTVFKRKGQIARGEDPDKKNV